MKINIALRLYLRVVELALLRGAEGWWRQGRVARRQDGLLLLRLHLLQKTNTSLMHQHQLLGSLYCVRGLKMHSNFE